jgi:hypothetical protein
MEVNKECSCDDRPLISICKKCGVLYSFNPETGQRKELKLSLNKLLELIQYTEYY